MAERHKLEEYEPLFEADIYTVGERERLGPWFTNLDRSVYTPLIFAPELVGALCSRASRAAGDLRAVFLREYVTPFLDPSREEKESDEEWQKKQKYSEELQALIAFSREHPAEKIFANPRARSFYIKWLAQYGDDSIAQMAGGHVVFSSLSQLAIKHFEDQRIGLAPIEKSTRYVDYSGTVKGQYRYYIDPGLADMGLTEKYREAMDGLFATYATMLSRLRGHLKQLYPEEQKGVVEKKAFDTLRGLLPVATLSQVAFFGNGQAFEYLISRSAKHGLGEVRWAAEAAYQELYQLMPSFLRRLKDPESRSAAEQYQEYLAGRGKRMAEVIRKMETETSLEETMGARVKLVEYDTEGEEKVIAGMLFAAPNNDRSWEKTLTAVRAMGGEERRQVLDYYMSGRGQRWQKVGRAFENAYMRWEIVMDIGAWRDLHRHRMLTQQRQLFGCEHGYEVPGEVMAAGFGGEYAGAMDKAKQIYEEIARHDREMAQYAVPMGYRVRFMQWQNIRECFWEMELRTIPEGHPSYRAIEQEKFRLFGEAYPLIAEYMQVNMGDYDFARRGQGEKIQSKLRSLERISN